MTSADHSKAMVLLLLMHCLLLPHCFIGFMFGPCFVVHYLESFLVSHHLAWEEKDGCFTIVVF